MDATSMPMAERGLGALERWRKRHNKTIIEMAEEVLGIHRSTYHRLLNGDPASANTAARVLAAVHIDISSRQRRKPTSRRRR